MVEETPALILFGQALKNKVQRIEHVVDVAADGGDEHEVKHSLLAQWTPIIPITENFKEPQAHREEVRSEPDEEAVRD